MSASSIIGTVSYLILRHYCFLLLLLLLLLLLPLLLLLLLIIIIMIMNIWNTKIVKVVPG